MSFLAISSTQVNAASLSNVAPNPNNSGPGSFTHVFFIRKSPNQDIQNKVESILYIPVGDAGAGDKAKWNVDTMEILPNGDRNAGLDGTICDVPAGTTLTVTLKAKGIPGTVSQGFNSSNACNLNGTGFFKKYQLPNWGATAPTSTGPSGRYEVTMTITFSTTSDNLGIRFLVQGNGQANMKVGQDGGVDYTPVMTGGWGGGWFTGATKPVPSTNFPIVGNWNDIHGDYNAGTINVPFGSCTDSGNLPVGVYDSDNSGIDPRTGQSFTGFPIDVTYRVKNMDTGQYVNFTSAAGADIKGSGAAQPWPGTGNLSASYFNMSKNTHYQLEIYNISPRNTVDVAVPGPTAFGQFDCAVVCTPTPCNPCPPALPPPGCPPQPYVAPAPIDKSVDVQAYVGSNAFLETGQTPTYTGNVEVSRFPIKEQAYEGAGIRIGWGYNEIASQKVTIPNANKPNQTPYSSKQGAVDATASGNVVIKRLCHDGQQRQTANCTDLGTYICAGGNANDSCGNYNWQCLRNNGAIGFFTSPATTNAGIIPKPAMCASQYKIQCADGVYRGAGNCTDLGTWTCQAGGNFDSCGNYYYTCEWTNSSGVTKFQTPGWQPPTPNCNIFQYFCRDTSGNLTNQVYKDFNGNEVAGYCNNKWICIPPSVVADTYDPAEGAQADYCKVWTCAYENNPQASNNQNAAENKCAYKCYTLSASPVDPPKPGDRRCYVQPYFNLTCKWTVNGVQQGASTTQQVNADGNNYCVTSQTGPAGKIGDLVCMTYALSATGWLSSVAPGYGHDPNSPNANDFRQFTNWNINTTDKSACVRIGGYPYVKVFGSDTRVGGGIGTSTGCLTNTGAQIKTQNYGSPTYSGAGTQYAALATGQIDGFVSGLTSAPGTALSFANTGVGSPYGGDFGSTGVPGCVNYVPPGMTAVPSPGLITFPASLPAGQVTTEYYKGDVFINSNHVINFAAGLAGMSSYRLVVDGNIYIGKNVTRLDGTYVALANSDPAKGMIYDCADGVGSNETMTLNGCELQLVVNGSFAARSVQLLRDCGSLRYAASDNTYVDQGNSVVDKENCTASSHAAEVFNYSPELWLVQLNNPGYDQGADSILSLPPVL